MIERYNWLSIAYVKEQVVWLAAVFVRDIETHERVIQNYVKYQGQRD